MLFLSQMPAMVPPKTDDRIVPMFRVLQSLQNSTNLTIEVADGRKIRLNRFLPASGLHDIRMIPLRLCHAQSRRRDVSQIVFLQRRQLNLLQWELIKILLRYIPGHMRLVKAQRQKERCPVMFLQLRNSIVRNRGVGDEFITALQHTKLNPFDTAIVQ